MMSGVRCLTARRVSQAGSRLARLRLVDDATGGAAAVARGRAYGGSPRGLVTPANVPPGESAGSAEETLPERPAFLAGTATLPCFGARAAAIAR